MNPLEQRIAALEKFARDLAAASTIPFNVDKAFRARLLSDVGSGITESPTNPTTATVSIDEAGAATHTVLNAPDGLLEVTLPDGTPVDVPYYNQ